MFIKKALLWSLHDVVARSRQTRFLLTVNSIISVSNYALVKYGMMLFARPMLLKHPREERPEWSVRRQGEG